MLDPALEKDPEERYQTVHDMLIDLRRLKKEIGQGGEAFRTIRARWRRSPPKGRAPIEKKLAILLVLRCRSACAGIVIVLLSHGPQLNPDMKSRVVQLPFRDVAYARMSRDGNWIVFPAADDRGKFDVYMMNVSQGQPRRITQDSCYHIYNVSLSPDASTILYSRRRSTPLDPYEIVSVSSLGGIEKVIVDDGYGQGGCRMESGLDTLLSCSLPADRSCQWWSCRPDGSDRRIEIADTVT